MSDHIMRGCRVQLTTAMDTVLRTAVFEIMKIFESALHDHKMQLAQKGEELAHLKVKLQKTELKLKDHECTSVKGGEKNQVPQELSAIADASKKSGVVPEVEFGVPDDWCAPLGYEVATKQEEDTCFGVRLRPFSIRLCHIPIRSEMVSCAIDLQRLQGSKRSRRIAALKKLSGYSLNNKTPSHEQGDQRRKGDTKMLLKQKNKKNGNPRRHKNSQKNDAAIKSSQRTYTCGICNKAFNTDFGRSVHFRSHKRCRGCKKNFYHIKTLKRHVKICPEFIKSISENAKNVQKQEENVAAPYKTQVVVKEENVERPLYPTKPERKKYFCSICSCTFGLKWRYVRHMRSHSDSVCACSICQRGFRSYHALNLHMRKSHGVSLNFSNGHFGWTKPLEDIEDN